MSSVSRILAQYADSLKWEDLSESIIHEAKRRVIDSVGCALASWDCAPAKILRKLVKINPVSEKGSAMWGTKFRTSPELATLHNGLLIRYLDYNDTYLSKEPAHPSDNLSAAVAMSEYVESSGRELLLALILGYEIQCALCDAASLRLKGWDHVTYGVFSTVLLSGKLLNLSKDKLEHAVALAGVSNNALRQTRVGELSMWKGCAFANAARNGVFAALLADVGMKGPTEIFEGRYGFFEMVSGPFEIQLGAKPQKMLESHIKYYPCEYHAQSAVEAVLTLAGESPQIDKIKEVCIETFDVAIDIIGGEKEKWHPVSRETADHSLPYCVGVALMDKQLGLDQFNSERILDPRLNEFIQRIKVKENKSYTELYPASYKTKVSIKFMDGSELSKIVEYPRGHYQNPISDDELEDKFRRLTGTLLTLSQTKNILDQLWNLDQMEQVSILKKLDFE